MLRDEMASIKRSHQQDLKVVKGYFRENNKEVMMLRNDDEGRRCFGGHHDSRSHHCNGSPHENGCHHGGELDCDYGSESP